MGSRDSVVGEDLETRGVSGEKASNMKQKVCHGARAALSGQARERVSVSPRGPLARMSTPTQEDLGTTAAGRVCVLGVWVWGVDSYGHVLVLEVHVDARPSCTTGQVVHCAMSPG